MPTVECKVIGNIDWNGFINDFMKEIHIIEVKPPESRIFSHVARILSQRGYYISQSEHELSLLTRQQALCANHLDCITP